jgi:hypothetical protein
MSESLATTVPPLPAAVVLPAEGVAAPVEPPADPAAAPPVVVGAQAARVTAAVPAVPISSAVRRETAVSFVMILLVMMVVAVGDGEYGWSAFASGRNSLGCY